MADPVNKATEPVKGWRTLGVAVALGGLGAVQTWLAAGGGGLIPIPYVGPALIGVGFLVAYMRSISDTPVGEK